MTRIRDAWAQVAIVAVVAVTLIGCGSDSDPRSALADDDDLPVLYIGGIPDQNVATVERQFELMAQYLSEQTGLDVRYAPATDYAAIVAAFKRGDVHLAWFGGLTGVQAQDAVEGSMAIAQRPRDEEFHSKFIVQAGLEVDELVDLKGLSFTFGSESSTSGHLMPRYFMLEAGVDPDEDLNGVPNYSGSHDATYKLVESGAFQAGALNEAVWEAAVENGTVDTSKVRDFYTTPAYYDYHWAIHGDVDAVFGEGTSDEITDALLAVTPEHSPDIAEMLELFGTDRFIATNNDNYQAIREIAEDLGILR